MSKPDDIVKELFRLATDYVSDFDQVRRETQLTDVWNIVEDELLADIKKLVARAIMAERERCAKVCEDQAQQFLSTQYSFNQPLGSFLERFACGECADAIRKGTENAP